MNLVAVSFFAAMLIYAVFGSPTPDGFGIVEILIAGLLLVSVRFQDMRQNLYAFSALLFGLSVPVIVGVIGGHDVSDMVRDIVPFVFMFLPLFYGWVAEAQRGKFLAALAGIGLVFSVRTMWAYRDILWTPILWGQGPPADLLYLANSPEVLFSAIYCLGVGGQMAFVAKGYLKGFGVMALSLLPLIAMALMMQRAGIGVFVLNGVMFAAVLFYFYPHRALGVIVGLVALGVVMWPFIEVVLATLWQKTELVGLNSRGQEWMAVLDVLSQDWTVAVFGEGWGGRIENPAVGGLNVNYTHSLISAVLLKTGALGAGVILSAAFLPVWRAIKGWREFIVVGALLSPLLISTFLYASYKSLGFGLILLAFSSFFPRKLEKNPLIVS